jgi:hypothetical protein
MHMFNFALVIWNSKKPPSLSFGMDSLYPVPRQLNGRETGVYVPTTLKKCSK